MAPVACGPHEYKRVPHFRASPNHEKTCTDDGPHRDAKHGDIRRIKNSVGPAERVPSVIVLKRGRPQLGDADPANPAAVPIHAYRRQGEPGASAGPHTTTAATLHPVALFYCEYPSERWRSLRIPGCAGDTYEACFRR